MLVDDAQGVSLRVVDSERVPNAVSVRLPDALCDLEAVANIDAVAVLAAEAVRLNVPVLPVAEWLCELDVVGDPEPEGVVEMGNDAVRDMMDESEAVKVLDAETVRVEVSEAEPVAVSVAVNVRLVEGLLDVEKETV